MTRIASVISNVLNAPFVCAYVLLIYYLFHPYHLTTEALIGVIVFLYLLPWGPVVAYSIFKGVSPSMLSNRERIPFVIIGLISYVAGAVYFCRQASLGIYAFLISLHVMYAIFSSILIIGNIFSKPSVHVGGFVAPIILLGLYTTPLVYILLVLAPVIGWSRVKLRIHTPMQLLTGAIIGVISPLLAHFIAQNIILSPLIMERFVSIADFRSQLPKDLL
ncbi:MAG: hypothetical protein ACTSX9_06940 [Candidatus Njordarchaeales archaeon]